MDHATYLAKLTSYTQLSEYRRNERALLYFIYILTDIIIIRFK